MEKNEIPSLLSPINSFEGAVRVVNAGAEEIYCGVTIPRLKDFMLFRGKFCAIPTYNELGKVVKYAHSHGVKVFLTMNIPFMVKQMEKDVKKHISLCLDEGIDSLIIADLGILSIVKSLNIDIPLIASTYLMSLNHGAIAFLEEEGFNRVALERHMTIPEISEVTRRSKIGIEVFVHGPGCSNINRHCYLYHYKFPRLIHALAEIDGSNLPCKLPFDVHNMQSKKLIAHSLPVLDAYTFCSLCYLPELVKTGVVGLKIVGRCDSMTYQENVTKIYREMLDLIRDGRMKTFNEKLNSLRKTNFFPCPANLEEIACEQERCYYYPLFHTPYKIRSSWTAWTMFQFKGTVFE